MSGGGPAACAHAHARTHARTHREQLGAVSERGIAAVGPHALVLVQEKQAGAGERERVEQNLRFGVCRSGGGGWVAVALVVVVVAAMVMGAARTRNSGTVIWSMKLPLSLLAIAWLRRAVLPPTDDDDGPHRAHKSFTCVRLHRALEHHLLPRAVAAARHALTEISAAKSYAGSHSLEFGDPIIRVHRHSHPQRATKSTETPMRAGGGGGGEGHATHAQRPTSAFLVTATLRYTA